MKKITRDNITADQFANWDLANDVALGAKADRASRAGYLSAANYFITQVPFDNWPEHIKARLTEEENRHEITAEDVKKALGDGPEYTYNPEYAYKHGASAVRRVMSALMLRALTAEARLRELDGHPVEGRSPEPPVYPGERWRTTVGDLTHIVDADYMVKVWYPASGEWNPHTYHDGQEVMRAYAKHLNDELTAKSTDTAARVPSCIDEIWRTNYNSATFAVNKTYHVQRWYERVGIWAASKDLDGQAVLRLYAAHLHTEITSSAPEPEHEESAPLANEGERWRTIYNGRTAAVYDNCQVWVWYNACRRWILAELHVQQAVTRLYVNHLRVLAVFDKK